LSAGYEKHVAVDYIIEAYGLTSIKFIIHVDDSVVNVCSMLHSTCTQTILSLHFPSFAQRAFELAFPGVQRSSSTDYYETAAEDETMESILKQPNRFKLVDFSKKC
jgi:hypothetical protein